ncbi:MAG: DUF177 domain-containing protein [Bacteroidales bacterium]|nr:DUF177 domain-containing protein [Bacteroidales bacterium]
MVKKNSELVIPFKGLDLGRHHYDFVVEDAFIKELELPDITGGTLEVSLELEKESTLMVFDFLLKGSVVLPCDRCLVAYEQSLEGQFRLIVKMGEAFQELSDEMVEIPATEARIDLSQYVYEYILLMLPLKKVHPDDAEGNSTCDPEMLKKLEHHQEKNIDPRWEVLKDLKNKK